MSNTNDSVVVLSESIITHPSRSTTGSSPLSSTSSSPVMVNVNDDNDHDTHQHHDTLLSPEDGDIISSDDDDDNVHDPLLVLSPPQQQQQGEEQEEVEGEEEEENKSTTTKTLMIFQTILKQYQKWFTTMQCRLLSSSPISSSSSFSSSTSFSTFSSLLEKYCKNVLSFYVQFITLPSNQDKILKFLQYTFYMVSQLLLLQQQRHRMMMMMMMKPTKFTYNNNTNNNNTIPPSPPVVVGVVVVYQKWLEKLYNELTWARYILRILQLPMAMDAAIHQSWTITAKHINNNSSTSSSSSSSSSSSNSNDIINNNHHSRQTLYNIFGRILTYSMVFYYPTELMAYLLWMKPKVSIESNVPTSIPPITTSTTTTTTTLVCDNSRGYNMVSLISNFYTTLRDPKYYKNNISSSTTKSSYLVSKLFSTMCIPSPETWSYLSCRCWLIYVITELIQSYVQYKELIQLPTNHPTTNNTLIQRNEKQQILLQSLRNLLFIIPCTTWSMPKWDTHPMVPLRTVNTLLWLESIVSMYQAILVQRNKNQLQEPDEQPDEQKCVN